MRHDGIQGSATRSHASTLAAACAGLWLCMAVGLSGCGSTPGALIAFPFEAGGVDRADESAPFTFETPLGWTVTLDPRTRVALGPFYFNVAPPSTNDFRSGVDITEVTRQVVVHPLSSKLVDVPGGLDGETGRAVSVEIGLLPPDKTATDDDANVLKAGFAFVAGTAVSGTTSVTFAGNAVINQALATPHQPLADLQRIKGADVDLDFTSDLKLLTLRVDPTHWFDQTDFNSIVDPSSSLATWDNESTFHSQLLQGLKSASDVYLFELSR